MKIYGSFWVSLASVGLCYAAATDFPGDLKATGVKVVFPGDSSYAGFSQACE